MRTRSFTVGVAMLALVAPSIAHAQRFDRDSAAILFERGADVYRSTSPGSIYKSPLKGDQIVAIMSDWVRAMRLYQRAGDPLGELRVVAAAANVWESIQLGDSAAALYRRGISIARQLDDRAGELTLTSNLLELESNYKLSVRLGPGERIALLTRAMTLAEERPHHGYVLSKIYQDVGRHYRWLAYHEQRDSPENTTVMSQHVDSTVRYFHAALRLLPTTDTTSVASLKQEMVEAFRDLSIPDSAKVLLRELDAVSSLAVRSSTDAVSTDPVVKDLLIERLNRFFAAGQDDSVLVIFRSLRAIMLERARACAICSAWDESDLPLEKIALVELRNDLIDSAITHAYEASVIRGRWSAGRHGQIDSATLSRIRGSDALLAKAYHSVALAIKQGKFLDAASAFQDVAEVYIKELELGLIGRYYVQAARLKLARIPTAASSWREFVRGDLLLGDAFLLEYKTDSAREMYALAEARLASAGQPAPARMLLHIARTQSLDSASLTLARAQAAARAERLPKAFIDSVDEMSIRNRLDRELLAMETDPTLKAVHIAAAARLALQLGDSTTIATLTDSLMRRMASTNITALTQVVDSSWIRGAIRGQQATIGIIDTLFMQRIEPSAPAVRKSVDRSRSGGVSSQARTKLAQERLRSQPIFTPAIMGSIGLLFARLGLADSALHYARAGTSMVEHNPLAQQVTGGATLLALSQVYSMLERPDSAIAVLARAQSAGSGMVSIMNQALFTSGSRVFLDVGRPADALAQARRALPRELDSLQSGIAGAVGLSTLADAYSRSGRPELALRLLATSLAAYDGSSLGLEGDKSEIYSAIARAHREAGRIDSALVYAKLALTLADSSPKTLMRSLDLRPALELASMQQALGNAEQTVRYSTIALAAARRTRDRFSEVHALQSLALGLQMRHAGTDLIGALAYHDSADRVLAITRARLGSDETSLSYSEQFSNAYGAWSLAWLARSGDDQVGKERSALAALWASERGRAQALLDLRRSSVSSSDTATARTTLDDIRALLARITPAHGALLYYIVTRDTVVTFVSRSGAELLVNRTAISDSLLTSQARELRLAMSGQEVDTARAIQETQRSIALLDFDDTGVRGGGRLAGGDATAPARRIADVVLPEAVLRALPDSGELVIVPQGVLGTFPFTMLPTDTAGTAVGARFTVRYAPSLALLGTMGNVSNASEVRASGTALVVGNPRMPSVSADSAFVSLGSLPGTATEANWIAKELGTHALVGDSVTETRVRSLLPSARVVHLATHGYAYSSERRARESFIVLSRDAANDGLLMVGEIMDDPSLHFSADLVVLSACQTGLGLLRKSEGTVGLQRAFLAKGARSVLVSLWSVSDVATELLMRRFYTHWLHDMDRPEKAAALQRAQADVRSNPSFAHPRYWAAFQLVGAR